MGKFIAILLLPLIAASCVTEQGVHHYTSQERMEAILVLGDDMIESAASEGDIDAAAFMAALPAEFTAYDGYSPIYDSLASSYTASLSRIVSPYLDICYSMVSGYVEEIAAQASDEAVINPEGVTDAVQAASARPVYDALLAALEEEEGNLDAAFREARAIFSSVRDSYLNLSIVGAEETLPDPRPIPLTMIAFAAEDELFRRLGDAERRLKSIVPETEDSPYAVFWEGTI